MPRIRIGISGWNYKPWCGRFYPRKLAQKRELEYASEQLNSIEINGTFCDDELAAWAKRIRSWARGSEPRDAVKFTNLKPRKRASRDVFVYFDNDAKVHAPFNAMRLAEMLGIRR